MNREAALAAQDAALQELESTSLVAGLLPDELTRVRGTARVHQLPPGAWIFRHGEPALDLYVIASGTVALTLPVRIRGTAQDITVEEQQKGAVIGWSALIPPHTLTLGGQTTTATTLVSLARPALERVFEERPRIKLVVVANLAKVIASRLCLLEGLLLRDLQRWITERVT